MSLDLFNPPSNLQTPISPVLYHTHWSLLEELKDCAMPLHPVLGFVEQEISVINTCSLDPVLYNLKSNFIKSYTIYKLTY